MVNAWDLGYELIKSNENLQLRLSDNKSRESIVDARTARKKDESRNPKVEDRRRGRARFGGAYESRRGGNDGVWQATLQPMQGDQKDDGSCDEDGIMQ